MAYTKALSILKPLTSYTARPKLPKYKPMGSAKAPSLLTVNSSNSLCAVESQLPKYKSMASTNTCFVQGEDEKLSSEIPVISLAGMDEVDGKREEICKKIVQACEDWGVFQLVDHGVETRLISEMTRLATDFFALPAQDKLRFDTTGGKRGGFTVLNNVQGEVGQNWREIVTYFAYPIQKRDYSRWPDSPEGWIKVTEQFSEQLMGLACKLLGVLSEAMGLEADAMKKACVDIDQKLMLNYYPKCPQPELTPGIKRHTDAGTITILLQDRVGGLQITRDDANTWIQVPAIEGAFVVSLGDHGHLLSNGRFKNADHQAEVKSSNGRLSIVAYMNPTPEATVYPLAVREGEPPILEEPITFAEMYRRKVGKDMELSSLKNG